MKMLSLLHRWTGGLIGLLLALLGLSGTILLWEDQWISLPYSNEVVVQDAAAMARVVDGAGPELARVTFASEGMSLHQLTFRDGSGAYVAQDETVVERWQNQWDRPELWLFDFHHHLFAGETGETVSGVAGTVGLLFVVTGVVLWWRSRRAFRWRLLPRSWVPGQIVAHHRDIGIVTSPLLLVSMATGVLMVFAPVRTALLGEEQRPRVALTTSEGGETAEGLMMLAGERFPGAAWRRLSLPRNAGDPMTLRLRQADEWTPNGRTQIGREAGGRAWVEDASAANRRAWLAEKLYPVHSAKMGGWLWRVAMTISGLALTLLGSFTTWSFWRRRAVRRSGRVPMRVIAL